MALFVRRVQDVPLDQVLVRLDDLGRVRGAAAFPQGQQLILADPLPVGAAGLPRLVVVAEG
ncbi:hypothetical protein AB0J83_15130 [Actinoplanes sp. NPDC049596]|uniref:hypothetical protein n=1 Tax=unclassified Actinoplanes TaxID=2626549 RepID=UPI00342E4646